MSSGFKSISDFFLIYQETAFAKDIPRMIDLYDEDVLIFDMWGEGFSKGLTAWAGAITTWLSSLGEENVRVGFEMIEIREANTVAFGSAMIHYQAVAPDGDIVRSMKNRITLGFVKREDRWKVVHQHTSAPVDDNLKAILDI